jgi:hypothetical protein
MKYDGRLLIAEILDYKKEIWEDNRFCECGADSFRDCECSSEKKKRFLRRRKKKVNEKFSEELDKALKSVVKADETVI